MNTFTIGNALSHWSNTTGPGGFVWKYVLGYALAAVVVGGLGFVIGGSIAFTGGFDEFGQIDPAAIPRLIAYYAWTVIAGILIWVMFEAAAQRRYQHGAGFSLKVGGDELRLLVVALFWLLTFVALYIGVSVVVGGLVFAFMQMSPQLGAIMGFIFLLAALGLVIFVLVRLSPAAAMTVRDKKIRFSSAWSATKGRFWSLFGSYFLMWLIALVVVIIVYFVVVVGAVGAIFAAGGAENLENDPEAAFAALMGPTTIVLGTIVAFGAYALFGLIQFAVQGIPGLAAKTDPNWSGEGSRVGDAFS